MSRPDYADEPTEIQEPAINEIKKPRSCAKRACSSGCGCAVIMIALIAAGVWLFAPAQPEKATSLPDTFPTDIPLYKAESITNITHLSGDRKKRGPEAAALIPKIILTPALLWLDKPAGGVTTTAWRAIREAVATPIAAYTNTTVVTWERLGAEPDFVDEWYYNEFSKRAFAVTRAFVSSTSRSLRFEKSLINGAIYIDDPTPADGTDHVTIRIDYP